MPGGIQTCEHLSHFTPRQHFVDSSKTLCCILEIIRNELQNACSDFLKIGYFKFVYLLTKENRTKVVKIQKRDYLLASPSK